MIYTELSNVQNWFLNAAFTLSNGYTNFTFSGEKLLIFNFTSEANYKYSIYEIDSKFYFKTIESISKSDLLINIKSDKFSGETDLIDEETGNVIFTLWKYIIHKPDLSVHS